IDGTRSRDDLVEAFFTDLRWLGLAWDGDPVFQSQRIAEYTAAAERLIAMGLLYPCTCTRKQVAEAAQRHGPDGPLYPGTCRGKTAQLGDDVAWRLDMAKAIALAGPLDWTDAWAGRQVAQPELFGDVVLLRRDAPASYHLAATLDDAADGITVVTRGADLFAASHIHRLLQALLQLPVPLWHHHGLLIEADGRKLAKRRGSSSLADLRQSGQDGPALAAALRAGIMPAGISLITGIGSAP
ncbi:MAG: hypothetical protein RLZZ136_1012, partial [Pseudomonadota bacterium]